MSDSGDAGGATAGHRDLSAGEGGEPEALPGGQAGPDGPPDKPVRRRRGWRTPVAALLIVIGCVLAPLSVVAVWTANQVSDTSRYVANVEPLIKDPAIQNALTDKLTSEIVTRINVKGLADQAATDLAHKGLPRISTLLRGVSGSLASGVQGFVQHPQNHHRPADGERVGAGEPGS